MTRTKQQRAEDLFDLFVGGQTSKRAVAAMALADATRHIHELREDEPDEIPMTDEAIARAILEFARS